ncbi:MAG TPA: methionine--tRNA ligase [Phycisphaerales bacterium]|nr:methionine--tRNA ligase [Phycisphaerales bacterium]
MAEAPYYVTTPIYYVNDRPHIGHCYSTLIADVAARFERLRRGSGKDVFFLTGTDEHAEKVVETAAKRDLSPQEWATHNAAEFRKAFAFMGFSNDDFVRTTEERHKARASAYIKKLMDSGDIELGDYEGWWDPSQEEYLTETLAKESNFVSPVSGKPLERRKEQNYFFNLPKYADRLEKMIAGDEIRVLPDARKNEVLGRIKGGLQRVPVSRKIKDGDADWGIRMPGDPQHRVYVWIEALCNYLSIVDNEFIVNTAAAEGGARRRFWPASVHLMAKDILWFHAVIWPAMLMGLGEKTPRTVYAHAFWVREGRKMSKSLGNFIEIETIEAYAKKYSLDAVRWYLLTQGPLGATDADFSHAKFVEVYNADLANGIGNCASRVGNMIEKYFGGEVPEERRVPIGVNFEDIFPSANHTQRWVRSTLRALDSFDLASAVAQARFMITSVDQFINATAPFKVAKRLDVDPTAKDELSFILFRCAEQIRIASILLSPVIPNRMANLWQAWNCAPVAGATLEELCQFGGEYGLKPGHRIVKGDPLYMRADPAEAAPTV